MPVSISINGDNAAEVLQELQGLAAGLGGSFVPLREPVPGRESEPKKRSAVKKEEKSKKEEPAEEKEAVVEESDSGSIPTVEEIRAMAQSVKDKEAVKALVKEFGAKNITSIPEERRAEFLSRLEEL